MLVPGCYQMISVPWCAAACKIKNRYTIESDTVFYYLHATQVSQSGMNWRGGRGHAPFLRFPYTTLELFQP